MNQESHAEKVDRIVMHCLYTDSEVKGLKEGAKPKGCVVVRGILSTFGFHPGRLKESKAELEQVIREVVPDEFLEDRGGGMSFLNLCNDREGNQWAEHRTMEALCALAIGLELASFPAPKEMWSAFPGGMPYVTFKNLHPKGG